MNDISNTEILTLEDLQQRRAEALEELRTQKQVMPTQPETYLLRLPQQQIKEPLSCGHLTPEWQSSTEQCLE